MVVRKRSWALNKHMGKRSYGCEITGILLCNGEVTGVWAVGGQISAMSRRVILKDERHENGPKNVLQRRSTVTRSVVSQKSVYAPPL